MPINKLLAAPLSVAVLLACASLFGGDAGVRTSVLIAREFDTGSTQLADGTDPRLSDSPTSIILKGRLKFSGSPAKGIGNFHIESATGKTLPFHVLNDSVFSEFGGNEVDSVEGFIVIPAEELAKGAPKLTWGGDVKGESIFSDSITLYKDSTPSYRSFILEKASEGIDNVANFATIEVVVDDYAKSYHYWYLAPMALLFILLFIRRIFGLWMPSTGH